MQFAVAELDRKASNVITIGTIAALDAANALVQVAIGALTTDWLPWLSTRAGADSTWWAPDIGEQCLVLAPSGELNQAVVLLGLYQDNRPALSSNPDLHIVKYRDGTTTQYDRTAGVLTVNCVGDINATAARSITAKAPQITLDGAVHITGPVTFDSGMTGSGDVVSGGKSLEHHTHSGVRSGGDTSGPPS